MRIRHLVLVLAAALLSTGLVAYAKPGDGESEGMTKSSNKGGNGNGNSGGDHGNSGTPPGNSGGTKLKVHPPQGTCNASDSSIDGLARSHSAPTSFGNAARDHGDRCGTGLVLGSRACTAVLGLP